MIGQDFLDLLRCPLDTQTRLTQEGERLVCGRCALRFPIVDGFPKLIVEEAELPAGCNAIADLPCQRHRPRPPAT